MTHVVLYLIIQRGVVMNKLNLLLVTVVLSTGCTQMVYLKKSPSETVLTSIKSNNNVSYSYTFQSNIPDSLVINNYAFDVNATYISNLKVYMNTKYNNLEGSSNKIDFFLVSCAQATKNANSGMQNTSNVLGALAGNSGPVYNNVLLTTSISIKVSVTQGEKELSKEIFVTDEYNGDGSSITTAQNSFDQAIGKSIIMIDKFLTSIE